MRKLSVFIVTSLDGYYEGAEGDLSWHNVDEEFNEFAILQLDEAGTLVFGRKTYQLMANYWPPDFAVTDDPDVAGRMNGMDKAVFSKTLTGVNWEHSKLFNSDPATALRELKQLPGKDLLIIGSNHLVTYLMPLGVLDEIRIMIFPVVIGGGVPVFAGLDMRQKLKLLRSHTFTSGNVLLTYAGIGE